MKGLDTNVLVRYITQDDPKQSRAASELMENTLTSEQPGYVNQIVLCELIWVLEDCYGQKRDQLSTVIEQLLRVAELRLEGTDSVRQALADFRNGNADFSDCLIARSNAANGCETTLTFDKKAKRSPGFSGL